jgi:hypothetical protein
MVVVSAGMILTAVAPMRGVVEVAAYPGLTPWAALCRPSGAGALTVPSSKSKDKWAWWRENLVKGKKLRKFSHV